MRWHTLALPVAVAAALAGCTKKPSNGETGAVPGAATDTSAVSTPAPAATDTTAMPQPTSTDTSMSKSSDTTSK